MGGCLGFAGGWWLGRGAGGVSFPPGLWLGRRVGLRGFRRAETVFEADFLAEIGVEGLLLFLGALRGWSFWLRDCLGASP